MTTRVNIFAYTAPGFAPEFLSINVDDEGVVITARSKAKEDGSCGDTVDVRLTPEQLQELARTLFSYACTNRA